MPGFASLIFITALLSVNLGLINLLPIPLLDGGHLVFYAYEFVFRRPPNQKIVDIGLKIGLALVLSLMLFATYNDLSRLPLVQKLIFFGNLNISFQKGVLKMRRKLNMRVVATFFVLLLTGGIYSTVAYSSVKEQVINEIRVLGNKRIERATVISYLKINKGDEYDTDKIDESLKSLFNTGLFADVNFKNKDNVLIIRVTENPIINRISFEGNKRLTNEILVSEISLRPRVVYTRTKSKK